MKNAWSAYVLMTIASRSATATRIGNSRQNDRFLRLRRRPWRGPEAGPSGFSAVLAAPEGPVAAGLSGWPSAAGPDVSAPFSELSGPTGWSWSGAADGAPSSGSAPGGTPRPAPLIRAPSDLDGSLRPANPRRGSPSSVELSVMIGHGDQRSLRTGTWTALGRGDALVA